MLNIVKNIVDYIESVNYKGFFKKGYKVGQVIRELRDKFSHEENIEQNVLGLNLVNISYKRY